MARSRNIKPGFFSNDELVELPFEARLLFIGLWTIPGRNPESGIHDQCDRVRQHESAQDHQKQRLISQ